IENLAFVLAADQGGHHDNGRETFGGSQVIDPWGTVLGRLDQGPGVCMAHLDFDFLGQCRAALPALEHRRLG
ncbi:MAG: nitrilase-related carbon-nitrogen hydrolase, partial [Acidithiobacillus sp.]